MTDQLFSVRGKVERAKKHMADLDAALNAFYASNPYKVGTKRDAATRKLTYYITSVADVPTEISQIAGEAIHGLRSALDHLAMQLWIAGTCRDPADGRHVYFPIMRDAPLYKHPTNGAARKVKGMRQEAIDAINATEPYKGGRGHQLWVLHELDNIDKHRFLIAVGSAFQSVDIGPLMGRSLKRAIPKSWPVETIKRFADAPDPSYFIQPADRLCPLKVGDELLIDGQDAELNEKIQFRFEVSLYEPQIAKSEPLLPFVHHLLDFVNCIIAELSPFV